MAVRTTGDALALAAVGLYGVLACTVSARRRELGIRSALGAGRADLVRLVLRQALVVTLSGALLGLLAAASDPGAVLRCE